MEQASGGQFSEREQSVLDWANREVKVSSWLRDNVASLDLDPKLVILGHVLDSIIGDDRSGFNGASQLLDDPREQDAIKAARLGALVRLNWEIVVEELPEQIREQLRGLKSFTESGEWENREQFLAGRDRFNEVWNAIRDQVHQDPNLSEAFDYYQTFEPEITSAFGAQQDNSEAS